MSSPIDAPPLLLCLISDGKAGHDTQLRGLQEALSQYFTIEIQHLQTRSGFRHCFQAVRSWAGSAKNTLVIGAGSASWRYLVLAKKIYRLRTVVLLKPRLWPFSWFDFVVAPRHDGLTEGGHIVCTEGVLNPVPPAQTPNANAGLILIGGPSKHHSWDEQSLLQQLSEVVTSTNDKQWKLTTSRRTPNEFLAKLAALNLPQLSVFPVDTTPANWVRDQLQCNAVVWVTEDSMSMVFEGLSAGVQVGLLSLPRKREGRVTRCIDDLVRRQWVNAFRDYQQHGDLKPAVPPLQEATRVASIIAPHLKAGRFNKS